MIMTSALSAEECYALTRLAQMINYLYGELMTEIQAVRPTIENMLIAATPVLAERAFKNESS